jgi:hypothetical protein
MANSLFHICVLADFVVKYEYTEVITIVGGKRRAAFLKLKALLEKETKIIIIII